MKAMEKEWDRRWTRYVWGHTGIREWSDVAKEAQRKGKTVHLGRLFGLCVQTGSELPDGDARKKFKYRVVFGGNTVIDQSWESAVFQNLGSSPSSMSAAKFIDYYSCLDGNDGAQAGAEQAYVQAALKGPETWEFIPPEGRPLDWNDIGFRTPVVRLRKSVVWHP